jgi:DNA end-binding protein Ku
LAPRSMWNGTVAFGEVIFPVKLYAVAQDRRVRFREVRLSDGCRIVHRRYGSESGQEVPSERIRKAYEISDGNQVVLEDDELASARGSNAKVIAIEQFVVEDQIDPIFYDRPYLLGAQPGGEHAYRVLQAALAQTGKVGIGRFTLRTREQLVALAAHDEALRLYTMRFADELIPSSELEVPSLSREPSSRELEMAERLVDTLAETWDPGRHEDRHRDAIMALIEQKASGAEVLASAAPEPAPTPDLLAALEQSIKAGAGRKRGAKAGTAGHRAPAKPTTAAKPTKPKSGSGSGSTAGTRTN